MQMYHNNSIDIPRILIAALRGGSGKTVVSIGVIAALARSGKAVAPFKKGPDYIDAGWLAMAAGRPCHNLDSFLFNESLIAESFLSHSRLADISIVEGNRGLYDGLDVTGATSSAALSILLQTPVILCIDCTKSTRTVAALVMGCMSFDPLVNIAGVILNRVAGVRHENLLRDCIQSYCGIPVVGAIPKLPGDNFPERHMGLIPTPEHSWASASIESISRIAEKHIDIEALCNIAKSAPYLRPTPDTSDIQHIDVKAGLRSVVAPSENIQVNLQEKIEPVRIGIVMDSAFQFYYPENLEALVDAGAELVYMSPLGSDELPDIDGLYIGGGFPETHAAALSENFRFRNALKERAETGLPIYAECGGLMYLGESLVLDRSYPMAGILPVSFGFSKRPQGHGYTEITVGRENPYFPTGMKLRGHEFHYSRVIEWRGRDSDLVFNMEKGHGIIKCLGGLRDGLCIGNVLATYTHLHALGCPHWARSLVHLAERERGKRGSCLETGMTGIKRL